MLVVLGLIIMSIGIAIIIIDGNTRLDPVILTIGGVLWAIGTITATFGIVKLARRKQLSEIGR